MIGSENFDVVRDSFPMNAFVENKGERQSKKKRIVLLYLCEQASYQGGGNKQSPISNHILALVDQTLA